MSSRLKRYPLVLLLGLLAFAVACTETEQANKLIGEGNKLVEEGNTLIQSAGAKYDQLYDNLNDENFSEEQARLKSQAADAADGFGKSAQKYREAANKFEEASRMKVDEKFKEYLTYKAQEFRKNAERGEVAQSLAKAFIESADGPALKAKIAELKPRVEQLSKEGLEFQQKADKIRAENSDKFKS